MSDHTDEPQDWPLRDWSARLRPPGRVEPPEEEPEDDKVQEETADEPSDLAAVEDEVEEETAGAWPQPDSIAEPAVEPQEPEILYDEDVDEVEPAGDDPVEELVEEESEPAPIAVEEHADGEFRVPGGYSVLEGVPTGHRRAVAIVVSRFNSEITNRLLDAALAELEEADVAQDAILVMPVPGAFELPIAAMALAKTRRYACVIALGCVIRGETPHFDFVAAEAASGLQLAGIETGVPVSFGVLTCDTVEQAEARIDRGAWAVRSALEMADAFSQLRTTAARQ
jgi:6,7-dimethyl-8-ribityllumazine synthase